MTQWMLSRLAIAAHGAITDKDIFLPPSSINLSVLLKDKQELSKAHLKATKHSL